MGELFYFWNRYSSIHSRTLNRSSPSSTASSLPLSSSNQSTLPSVTGSLPSYSRVASLTPKTPSAPSLQNSQTGNISSKLIVDQILAQEHHHIVQSRGNATAFFAKAKKGKPAHGNRKVKCSFCKNKGHKKADCCKLKKKKEEEAAAKANSALGLGFNMLLCAVCFAIHQQISQLVKLWFS